jgi:hypothetical protein
MTFILAGAAGTSTSTAGSFPLSMFILPLLYLLDANSTLVKISL